METNFTSAVTFRDGWPVINVLTDVGTKVGEVVGTLEPFFQPSHVAPQSPYRRHEGNCH